MPRVLAAQIRYQLTLLTRTPRVFIFGVVMPGVLLALEVGKRHASSDTLTAAVAGLTIFGTLSIAYLSYASALVVAREDGVLRRWHASPLPAWAYFTGRIVAAILSADLAALVVLLTGVSMAGLHLGTDATASMLVAVTLGALTLACAGTAITPLLPSGQGANGVLAVTYVPLLIFSGGFGGGVQGQPHWLTTLMTYLPVQPVIDAATHALSHPGPMPARDVVVLLVWAVACLTLAARFFRWDPVRPAHARRSQPA